MVFFSMTLRIVRILLPAALCLAATMAAQPWQPSYDTFTLPNGLRVVLHRDTTLPLVSLHMTFHAGSARDPRGKHGLANLAGSLVLGGTAGIPSEEYDRIQAEPNVTTASLTTVDWSTIYAEYPAHLLETALWVEADRLRSAGGQISKSMMEQGVKGVLEQKRAVARKALGDLQEGIYREMYPEGYPYAHITSGDTTDLKRLALDDVRRFIRRYYVPANMSLTIGGAFQAEQARAWVASYFGAIPAGEQAAWDRTKTALPPLGTPTVIRQEDVSRSQLHLVFPTVALTDPDEPALSLVSKLLAGSASSRLANLPDINPNVLSVAATHSAQELDGTLWIIVTCRVETRLQTVYDQVLSTLRDIARDGVPETELAAARNNAEMTALTPLEAVAGLGGRCDVLNVSSLLQNDPSYLFRRFAQQATITEQDVRRVVNEHLLSGNHLILSVVPPGKPQLAVSGK
jgi:zinc protease